MCYELLIGIVKNIFISDQNQEGILEGCTYDSHKWKTRSFRFNLSSYHFDSKTKSVNNWIRSVISQSVKAFPNSCSPMRLIQVQNGMVCSSVGFLWEQIQWKNAFGSKLTRRAHACKANNDFISCKNQLVHYIKFIYSEKATKFCEISTLLLTGTTYDKSKVEIRKIVWPSQNK